MTLDLSDERDRRLVAHALDTLVRVECGQADIVFESIAYSLRGESLTHGEREAVRLLLLAVNRLLTGESYGLGPHSPVVPETARQAYRLRNLVEGRRPAFPAWPEDEAAP